MHSEGSGYSSNREGRTDGKGEKCEGKNHTHTLIHVELIQGLFTSISSSLHLEPAGQKQTQREEQGENITLAG